MKRYLPLLWLLLVLDATAQPKIVATLSYNGPLEGGTIFRSDLASTIHSFNNFNPHRPTGGVCVGNANWLYGIVQFNGTNINGGLYRVMDDGTGFTMLHNLDYSGGTLTIPYFHTDGLVYFGNEFELKKYNPSSGTVTTMPITDPAVVRNLLFDANDWIYYSNSNTVTKIMTDGTNETQLHSFNPATEGNSGVAGLTETPGDTLFGVQVLGGTNDGGTIYSLKKDGTGFVVHHHFTLATGIYPESRLVYFDGKLFGSTTQGGDFNNGVLFRINPDGSGYTVIHHFAAGISGPIRNLSISSNGRIFGAFYQFFNSAGFNYRMFKLDTSGANFELFFNVDQREHGHFHQDVLLVNSENMFVVTMEMGRHDGGVISEADTTGVATPIHHFGYSVNGFRPVSVIKATDGKLYGVTLIGGTSGNGVIFSMNADGSGFSKMHEFTDAQGYVPSGRLLEANDGKLYGTCRWGNALNTGCIYRIDKNGSNFMVIYSSANLADGYNPVGSLVEDNSGILYGVNTYSSPGQGTIFKINKDGSGFTLLKAFTGAGELGNPMDGFRLSGTYLYGTCTNGGAEGKGGVFRIQTSGAGYEVLHDFVGANEGSGPYGSPVIANNGMLYGTTANGGVNNEGTIYRMNLDGTNYTKLRDMDADADGGWPYVGLIQASDGLLHGIAFAGNFAGGSGGTIFRLALDGSGFTVLESFDGFTEGFGGTSILDLEGTVLPVNLLTFTGSRREKSVVLNWKTTLEINSRNFDIERSANGVLFQAIGSVNAARNTNSITSYSFTDENPMPGINFYRLKMVDLDGSYKHSGVIRISFDKDSDFQVYPNPATDRLQVTLPANHKVSILSIYDGSGRLVQSTTIDAQATQVSLDIQRLSRGWHVIKAGDLQRVFVKN